MLNGEPVYQIQHEKFILSFYADDVVDEPSIRQAAEDRIRRAYQLRRLEPPSSITNDAAKIASMVAADLQVG